jgi:hypothetical protein
MIGSVSGIKFSGVIGVSGWRVVSKCEIAMAFIAKLVFKRTGEDIEIDNGKRGRDHPGGGIGRFHAPTSQKRSTYFIGTNLMISCNRLMGIVAVYAFRVPVYIRE